MSSFKYLRQVEGKTGIWVWQARPHFDEVVGHVHLGCYRAERAAWDAVKAWLKAGPHPCRGLPPGILPKWAVRRPQDGFYDAIRRSADGTRLPVPGGPWATPEAAHAAARAEVERELAARDAGGWWPGRTWREQQICRPAVEHVQRFAESA